MGRKKKQLLKVVIPNSLLGIIGLNEKLEASNYKLTHFISCLTKSSIALTSLSEVNTSPWSVTRFLDFTWFIGL